MSFNISLVNNFGALAPGIRTAPITTSALLTSSRMFEGFDIIVEHGYDVHEAVELFKHLKDSIEEEEIKTNYFFSTHPGVRSRIKSYEKLIVQKGLSDTKGLKDKSGEFDRFVKNIVSDNDFCHVIWQNLRMYVLNVCLLCNGICSNFIIPCDH